MRHHNKDMPLKGSSSSTIKDYLATTENQSGKNKNTASKVNKTTMPNEGDTIASKQLNKTHNTLKETNARSKPKMQTMQSNNKEEASSPVPTNEHNPASQKRNATNQSPLEGHTDKKTKRIQNNTTQQ